MTKEGEDFGENSSILNKIQTRIASIKIKEDRLEAEKKQAAEEILSLLGDLSDTLPATHREPATQLKINETIDLRAGESKTELAYDPSVKEYKYRIFEGGEMTEFNINHEYRALLRDGVEIAQELSGRAADIGRLTK